MPTKLGSSEPFHSQIVLASRSPRRRELLQLIAPAESIVVVPPRESAEAGFTGLHNLPAIEEQLSGIARTKCDDVCEQVSATSGAPCGHIGSTPESVIIAADTVIVAADAAGRYHVLGQPPEDDTWAEVVRGWFHEYYAGRTHLALTALRVRHGEKSIERIVRTEVTFTADVDRYLDWYLASDEPRGKAGGYAIQGAGSLFVTNVSGSLSNVIGLPLEALSDIFKELGIHSPPSERRG